MQTLTLTSSKVDQVCVFLGSILVQFCPFWQFWLLKSEFPRKNGQIHAFRIQTIMEHGRGIAITVFRFRWFHTIDSNPSRITKALVCIILAVLPIDSVAATLSGRLCLVFAVHPYNNPLRVNVCESGVLAKVRSSWPP